jgi:outer membrane lipoprotein-sorting protein
MKTIPYITILITFLSCSNSSKIEKPNFEKVKISTEKFDKYSQYENLFVCKDSIEDFDNGYSKIELNGETIKILNSKNDGYESTQIEILIDKNLRIIKAKYSYSDDVENGSKSEYKIIHLNININHNPFEINPKQINASYLLKIKEKYIPSEFWKFNKSS